MQFEEAKKVFLNRGYVEVEGGTLFDGVQWRNSVVAISKWIEGKTESELVTKALQELRVEIEEYKNLQPAISICTEDLEKGKQTALEWVLSAIDDKLDLYKGKAE